MHEDFRAQVASSAVLKQRFDTIAAHIIDAARQEHGVEITADDVVNMPVARLSTYAASDDYVSGWRDEAVLAPAVAKAKERERLQAALEANGDTPEARRIAARLAEIKPDERIAWARQQGLTGVKAERPVEHSPEEKAALIKQAESLPAGMRIAFCRKHGLT